MPHRNFLAALAVVAVSALPLAAQEKAEKSRIVSVGLFKNGLAIVQRELTVPGPGTYRLDDVPEPVHGTFWIASPARVDAATEMREVEMPPQQQTEIDYQQDLAGKKVTIHFRGGHLAPVNGTVVQITKPKTEEVAERPSRHAYFRPEPAAQRLLILQTGKGRVYVDSGEIAYVEAEGAAEPVKRRKPVLLLKVGEGERQPTRIAVTYLARGMSWAPSYRVDISDPKTLAIEQNAVIKNELADLKDVEVRLISGYPSVQYLHVPSPLSPRTSLDEFFQALNNRPQAYANELGNVAMQQAISPSTPSLGLDLSARPTGEGVDLHYESIGKRTLARGDSLALSVARDKAAYERIVEWLVPDSRDEHGRYAGARRGDADPDGAGAAWDALRFKNPFPFPMTTAPAMVSSDGKFNGQRLSYWVNSGEQTILRVNKALSVRTFNVEHEDQKNGVDDRQFVFVGGRRFRKTTVEGELAVNNHRKEAIELVIRRRFSGDLLQADGKPKSTLREEGVWSVNKRNELVWTFPLKSGEEKRLTYRYTVLVEH